MDSDPTFPQPIPDFPDPNNPDIPHPIPDFPDPNNPDIPHPIPDFPDPNPDIPHPIPDFPDPNNPDIPHPIPDFPDPNDPTSPADPVARWGPAHRPDVGADLDRSAHLGGSTDGDGDRSDGAARAREP